MITLNNVSFRYSGSNFKINNVSFKFEKQKIYAIIGNNGSGKSTLAQLISGILKPQSGTVLINEQKLEVAKKQNNVKIGVVFSNPDNQIIFNNVYDDIAFTLKNYQIAKSEFDERINYALEKVGMLPFKNHETFNLSSGQKQRIAIAGMLSLKPEIIIFDECTSMLDPTSKEELKNIFVELKNQGITVIFATNILDEIIIADEVLVMQNGELVLNKPAIDLVRDLSTFEKLNMVVPTKLKLFNILLGQNKINTLLESDLINAISGGKKWLVRLWYCFLSPIRLQCFC